MRGGTGRCPRFRHVYVSIVFIAYCLYGGGTFFVPSRLAGILVSVACVAGGFKGLGVLWRGKLLRAQ